MTLIKYHDSKDLLTFLEADSVEIGAIVVCFCLVRESCIRADGLRPYGCNGEEEEEREERGYRRHRSID